VQSFNAKIAIAGGQSERRVDEAHVPGGVAPGVLVARGQEHPAMGVERLDDRLDRVSDGDLVDSSMDADPARGLVRGRVHTASSGEEPASAGRSNTKAAPVRGGSRLFPARARARRGRPPRMATTTSSS